MAEKIYKLIWGYIKDQNKPFGAVCYGYGLYGPTETAKAFYCQDLLIEV